MELIITGLLIIIILLLWDKRSLKSPTSETKSETKSNPSTIIGKIKQEERQALPSSSAQRQFVTAEVRTDNFDSETKEQEIDQPTDKKSLEDILVKSDDWEEEEEDWQYENFSEIESGFATGVTFQELSTVGQLLQEEFLEPALEQQAVNIIQKIQETELFSLLENSLEGATKRIADLLSQSISNADIKRSPNRKNESDGFDIGEFL
ncbi:hypothetical protein [Epilithonimonas arachidiradicis]|uniref:Conjugal transfer protein TraD n=1 Tax=Epilithonimonas arachidiradicis TaxID=1617282 RepID=A0A420D7P2_9FLAO|nr:hypothetical protein [Epilithonimonas arachidiradicis]RKE86691.1 hypothetical protein BXY58_2516 [Epilithonimonas arachidiradicis]GGG62629.1 hypothetical protein GCM10007332_25910 [Epilithonimonas arachidiradicis]